jgi:hypothetical protein
MQILIGLLIDICLRQVRDPEFSHRERLLEQQIAAMPDQPVIVMLGSSRVHNGLDAKTATAALNGQALVFNCGMSAAGPFMEQICFERLREQDLRPDLVLIEVVPAYFNERTAWDVGALDGARLSAVELTELEISGRTLSGPVRRWLSGRLLPVYRHQAELRGLLGIDARRDDERPEELRLTDAFGWLPRGYPPERRAILCSLAHRQYDACYRDFRLSRAQVDLLERLLLECRRDEISPILVLTPEGSEFRQLYSPEMTRAVDGMLADLRVKYGVPIIDARAWMDDGCFSDMHHLLPDGARAFSARLAREGIAPNLPATKSMRLASSPPRANHR